MIIIILFILLIIGGIYYYNKQKNSQTPIVNTDTPIVTSNDTPIDTSNDTPIDTPIDTNNTTDTSNDNTDTPIVNTDTPISTNDTPTSQPQIPDITDTPASTTFNLTITPSPFTNFNFTPTFTLTPTLTPYVTSTSSIYQLYADLYSKDDCTMNTLIQNMKNNNTLPAGFPINLAVSASGFKQIRNTLFAAFSGKVSPVPKAGANNFASCSGSVKPAPAPISVSIFAPPKAQPVPAPPKAQPVPAPAQPAKAQPVPAPAQPAPAKAQPVPAPAQPAKAQPVPAPVQPAPAKAQPVPAPAKAQPVPAPAQPAPAKAQPVPAPAQPAPAKAQPVPAPAQPAPAKAQPGPAPASGPHPVKYASTPVPFDKITYKNIYSMSYCELYNQILSIKEYLNKNPKAAVPLGIPILYINQIYNSKDMKTAALNMGTLRRLLYAAKASELNGISINTDTSKCNF